MSTIPANEAPAWQSELRTLMGRAGPVFAGPDPVNAAMIRHWCAVIGDRNPVYTSEALAVQAGRLGVIAPPAMLQAWVMPGYGVPPMAGDPTTEFYRQVDAQGYTSIVATNCEQEYLRELRLGDTVHIRKVIEAISDEKKTALGQGMFLTTRFEFTDQSGEPVARMLHRVLKFKPATDAAAAQAASGTQALQPRRKEAQDIVPLFRLRTDLYPVMQGSERAIGYRQEAMQALPSSVAAERINSGARLAPLEIALTRSYIVAAAIATRDYQEVHHDPDIARQRGSQDVFLNILATTGLVSRYVTDALGPMTCLRKLVIKLGATAYPGDQLVLTGTVVRNTSRGDGSSEIVVEVKGSVSSGAHVTGEVTATVPST